jgi:hypothetical protein
MTIIQGHPTIEAHREGMTPLDITVCGECERMRTIIFLDDDRWLCANCRNSGSARPKQFAVSNPARRRK